MANPIKRTLAVFNPEDQVSKLEMLGIPNVTADFHINHQTELLLQVVRDMWENVVGVLRLEGLRKTYRAAGVGRPAVGMLSVVARSALVDGETFTISDGVNTPTVFEYDVAGNGVGVGHVQINVSALSTVDDVRLATINAINGVAGTLTITASPEAVSALGEPFGEKIFLVNDTVQNGLLALDQNVTITDTVADERFTHQGMFEAHPANAVGFISFPVPGELVDAETFTLRGASGAIVYEFDTNSSTGVGNIQVNISAAVTDVNVRDTALTAINAQTGASGIAGTSVNRPARGTITVVDPQFILEGDRFTLRDGTNTRTFEFDRDGSVTPGNILVNIATAQTYVDVRAAVIAAINAATLLITGSHIGFGKVIDLVHDTNGNVGNQTSDDNVVDDGFVVTNMSGGTAGIRLHQQTLAGTAGNLASSDTVASALFSVEGMSGGVGAGWDVTFGHCAFAGFDIYLNSSDRIPTVVGQQNWLKVRVTETRHTVELNPDEVQFEIPGLSGGPFNGPNRIVWEAALVIEGANAVPPVPTGEQQAFYDGILAEFNATDGQTIVALSEVPVRSTKFGRYVEPQDVTQLVSIFGDTMVGQLLVQIDGLLTPNTAGIDSTGHGTGAGVIGRGGATSAAGLVGIGGAANGDGVQGTGDGTGAGVRGTGGDAAGGHGVVGQGGPAGGRGGSFVGVGFNPGVAATGGPNANGGVFTGGAGASSAGVAGNGIGAGTGVQGFGGSTSGTGVFGTGGDPNGIGVEGEGSPTGTGDGVRGTGGGTDGTGVHGIGGGSNGDGVVGEGTGDGTGVVGFGQDGDAVRGELQNGATTGAAVHGFIPDTTANTGDNTAAAVRATVEDNNADTDPRPPAIHAIAGANGTSVLPNQENAILAEGSSDVTSAAIFTTGELIALYAVARQGLAGTGVIHAAAQGPGDGVHATGAADSDSRALYALAGDADDCSAIVGEARARNGSTAVQAVAGAHAGSLAMYAVATATGGVALHAEITGTNSATAIRAHVTNGTAIRVVCDGDADGILMSQGDGGRGISTTMPVGAEQALFVSRTGASDAPHMRLGATQDEPGGVDIATARDDVTLTQSQTIIVHRDGSRARVFHRPSVQGMTLGAHGAALSNNNPDYRYTLSEQRALIGLVSPRAICFDGHCIWVGFPSSPSAIRVLPAGEVASMTVMTSIAAPASYNDIDKLLWDPSTNSVVAVFNTTPARAIKYQVQGKSQLSAITLTDGVNSLSGVGDAIIVNGELIVAGGESGGTTTRLCRVNMSTFTVTEVFTGVTGTERCGALFNRRDTLYVLGRNAANTHFRLAECTITGGLAFVQAANDPGGAQAGLVRDCIFNGAIFAFINDQASAYCVTTNTTLWFAGAGNLTQQNLGYLAGGIWYDGAYYQTVSFTSPAVLRKYFYDPSGTVLRDIAGADYVFETGSDQFFDIISDGRYLYSCIDDPANGGVQRYLPI